MTHYLRKRIELLAPARIADEAGGASEVFAPVEPAWAEIAQLSSVRNLAGGGKTPLRRLVAHIRWRAGPEPGWRVRASGTDYEITSIEISDGKERFMTLVCEEVPA